MRELNPHQSAHQMKPRFPPVANKRPPKVNIKGDGLHYRGNKGITSLNNTIQGRILKRQRRFSKPSILPETRGSAITDYKLCPVKEGCFDSDKPLPER